jgi:hypothetical protein
MKKIILILIATIGFISCEETESTTFDAVNGQTAVAFTDLSLKFLVPLEGTTASTGVEITTASEIDRSFDVKIDDVESDLPANNYTIGTITIPANTYSGTLMVDFTNNDLEEGRLYNLDLLLDLPEGVVVSKTGGDRINFEIGLLPICNNLELSILADGYTDETTWEILDQDDNVVAQGGPYPTNSAGTIYSEDISLADGCYTFTIFDSYGDGLSDGTNIGTYALECSIITHASGSGNFGYDETTEFCVN